MKLTTQRYDGWNLPSFHDCPEGAFDVNDERPAHAPGQPEITCSMLVSRNHRMPVRVWS